MRPVRHGERHLCAAISIHAPLAGCDLPQDAPVIFEGISIHAPLAGCDAALRVDSCMCSNFNPRTPCGVRPADLPKAHAEAQFQSTHPLRGATLVSPPALLALCISIHAPLAGCDFCGIEILSSRLQFQSTHPLRGATAANYLDDETILFQSTHPLRGATRSKSGYMILTKFQSTHPLRGATDARWRGRGQRQISIHAPLAGCDRVRRRRANRNDDFNPRTPCGVRPGTGGGSQCRRDFNPRTPCGVRPRFSFQR